MFWKCSLVLGVLLFTQLPRSAFAQLKLIDLKIALKETHTWTDDSNKPPVDSDKFVVPGPGRARFTYSGSPLFKSQLFYIGVQFPGSNQKLFPGAMVDSNEKDRKETFGQPFVWSWTQEFTAEEKGMEVACELKPVDNYRGGSGWTYPPQEARFVVEWLGTGSETGGTKTVDIAGVWKHGSSGETWTFTPKGDGTYTATEKGFSNAKGTATFKGNKIHIDYQTDQGVTGEYDVAVSADGLTGKGSWTDDSPDSGSRDFVKIDQPNVDPVKDPLDESPTQFTVRAGSRRLNAGDTVVLPIDLLEARGLGNINVTVEYDVNVVQVTAKPTAGGVKGGRSFEANHAQSGTVYLGLAGSAGIESDGQLALIPFKAVGQPGDKTDVKVAVTTANQADGQKMQALTIDGTIEIVKTGGDGSGDSDNDSKITGKDALDALKMSVKLLPENMAADMDGDSNVTSNDARLILLKVVGK